MRGVIELISRLLWIVVLIGAAIGGANFLLTYGAGVLMGRRPDIGAPQVGALACECLAFAVLPYVFARGWDELTRPLPGRARHVGATLAEEEVGPHDL